MTEGRNLSLDVPFDRRTIPLLMRRQAALLGPKELAICESRNITFEGACLAASSRAHQLAHGGVNTGHRVLIMGPNGAELIEWILGTVWRGAVAVPVNPRLRGRQLAHVLSHSDPYLALVEKEFLPVVLDALAGVDGGLRQIWVYGGSRSRATVASTVKNTVPVSGVPETDGTMDSHVAQPGDTAFILYTSGTTGLPKGVCCPHAQFYWWARLISDHLAISEEDRLYTTLPLCHTNAISTLCQALLTGSTAVFGERFSASSFMPTLAETGATVTYMMGAMAKILLDQPRSSADRAHRVRLALSPATPRDTVLEFQERFGIRLVEGYGSTETNKVMSNLLGGYRPGTMGKLVPEFEAKVVDENDVDVPDGNSGELVLRHSEPFSFATGYFRDPEETVARWRNLWFHTGDRVIRDRDGSFLFVDRLGDSIRRKGENISSYEIELVLSSHPDVHLAAVVPTKSESGEEEIRAFIVLGQGREPRPVDVISYCRRELAEFAIPRFIDFVSSLPKTSTGKLQKYLLREVPLGQETWDRTRYEGERAG